MPNRKSSLGQAEAVFISATVLLLASSMVIAQNATNITNITGNLLGIISPSESRESIESSGTIEVWANSIMETHVESTELYDNESLIAAASLSLDNGSAMADVPVKFYLDGELIGSRLTNTFGQAGLEYPMYGYFGKHALLIVFEGGDFVNPSSEEMNITVEESGISNVSIETSVIQEKAVTGEPVNWKKTVTITNPKKQDISGLDIDMKLPASARGISGGGKSLRGIRSMSAMQIGNNGLSFNGSGLHVGRIPADSVLTYEFEYETPAPEKTESVTDNGLSVSVVNSGDVHYRNVSVSVPIKEMGSEVEVNPKSNVFAITDSPEFSVNVNKVKLFWTNGTEQLFSGVTDVTRDENHSMELIDTNSDGKKDTARWDVPILSEQSYLLTEENSVDRISAHIESASGKKLDIKPEITETADGYTITIPSSRSVVPGRYLLVVETEL